MQLRASGIPPDSRSDLHVPPRSMIDASPRGERSDRAHQRRQQHHSRARTWGERAAAGGPDPANPRQDLGRARCGRWRTLQILVGAWGERAAAGRRCKSSPGPGESALRPVADAANPRRSLGRARCGRCRRCKSSSEPGESAMRPVAVDSPDPAHPRRTSGERPCGQWRDAANPRARTSGDRHAAGGQRVGLMTPAAAGLGRRCAGLTVLRRSPPSLPSTSGSLQVE
jgi:hypothetical protein